MVCDVHPWLKFRFDVNLERAREERELETTQRLAQRVAREQAVDVLVSVAAHERELKPLGPLAIPVRAR